VTTITTGRMQLVGAEFRIRLTRDPDGRDTLAEGHLTLPAGDYVASQTIEFPEVNLEVGQIRFLFYTIHSNSPLTATRVTLQGQAELPLDLALTNLVSGDVEGKVEFTPGQTTRFNRLVIGDFQMTYVPIQTTLQVKLARDETGQEVLAEATATTDFPPGAGGRSEAPTFSFSPVNLGAGTTYYVVYKVTAGGPVTLAGDTLTLETSWDDALPQRVDDYDPLGGLYEPLNLELYEPDTPAKRERMLDILAQANYIVIPSNRAYDAMPRLPLRYPMTLKYYQALFNCQCIGDDMEAQAYEAVPPLKGPLGFELVATFESRLNFGPISISDQTADESFTVYDHPKVLIFKKSSDFSLQNVRAILESVDLTQVVDQSPMAYTMMPGGLRLTPDRLAAQKAGGTWFEMFDAQSILNRNQTLGVLAWYLTLLLLGWLAFPLVFVALPGLADRGYPLVRLIVLLLMAWVTWLLSSLKLLPFTQAALGFSAGGVAAIGIFMAVRNRSELLTFVRARWRYLLGIEGLFLALFVFDLMVRLGNPDLWHPWLGGEKPMDLAFFDAILKTVYFPPPNPWFSGYYINYYYYGYVISAVLTKLLGIVPAIAYNLILPTWFAMTGVGAFCVTHNLVTGPDKPTTETVHKNPPTESLYGRAKPILAGVVVVVLMLFLGNLYQARQLWKYLPEVSAPGSMNLTWYQRAEEAFLGAQKVLSGQAALPGDKGRWYFGPSRPILHDGQDTPIAEFPYFSFLYGDLHPHLLAMPITFAALAWMLSVLFASTHKRRWLERIVMWFVAGLVFGVFYPAHTWDFPVWLGLGALAVCWSVWQARREVSRAMWLAMVGQVALLVGIAVAMYYPFRHWFGTSYSSFEVWKGARTPLDDYLTVHGLFLFILVTFLFWESRDWLKSKWTVLSSHPLGEWFARNNAWKLIYVGAVFAVLIVLWRGQYQVLVLALPLLAWIGFLLARQGQSLPKRIVLMALGVGIAITAVVEVVVLQGDVGRSNTVFNFYLQVWALFSVAASATLVELMPILRRWSVRWRRVWWAALFLLVLAAAMYPLIATGLKMADRWPDVAHPPRSLDGMAYMLGDGATQPAVYNDENRKLNLASDYAGIRWMQEHVIGTPTIVEGYTAEYRWGGRYSIYTGLPTVVGWNWHVRQQNTVLPEVLVEKRIEEVNNFYNTPDPTAALEFLRRYQVEYIVVGDLERAYYSANGLAKFQQMVEQGHLRDVFSKRDDSSWVTLYKTSSP
jgi:YYY domain-containing protein